MSVLRVVSCALILAAAAPSAALHAQQPAAAAAAADDLTGLWKAKLRFGPDARGPLLIQREGAAWTADFAGRRTPMRQDGDVLSFALPNGEGSFRAKLHKGGLGQGQWVQPGSPINGIMGSNVAFRPDGPNRWRGEVMPYDNTLTAYLLVQRRPDGTLGTFLRNPERNLGVFVRADRIERQGDAVRVLGKAQEGKPEPVLMSGTWDKAAGGFTLAFPRNQVSLDFRRDGDDSAFWPRGRHPERYVYRPPPALGDGWPVARAEEVGIDPKGIEAFVQYVLETPMDSVEAPEFHAVLIARHGKLVVEEYFHGESRDRPHDTRSASKSLTATLIGAAMQAGLPVHLDDKVYAVMNGGRFPEGLEERKRQMTLENLMTMNSGHFCDDGNDAAPGNESKMTDESDDPDYYHYTMQVPMDRTPGERAVYCSADPNLAIGVLWRATGEHPMDLYDRLLGEPLQIKRDVWFMSPARQPYGGGGARFTPRDFMKLGQLMLNGGTWKGKRILSREFVQEASTAHYRIGDAGYGYLWWVREFPYKDRIVRAYFASGNGGQGVFVVPELDLVVAIYAGNYAARAGFEVAQGYTGRFILPAVREPGDPKDAPYAPVDFDARTWKPPQAGRRAQ